MGGARTSASSDWTNPRFWAYVAFFTTILVMALVAPAFAIVQHDALVELDTPEGMLLRYSRADIRVLFGEPDGEGFTREEGAPALLEPFVYGANAAVDMYDVEGPATRPVEKVIFIYDDAERADAVVKLFRDSGVALKEMDIRIRRAGGGLIYHQDNMKLYQVPGGGQLTKDSSVPGFLPGGVALEMTRDGLAALFAGGETWEKLVKNHTP